MADEESLITEEMRARIDIESEPWTIEVERAGVRMFARSCQYTDPIFFDEAFAKSKGYRSLPAPPHFMGTPIFNPVASDPTFGGPRGGGGPRAGNPKLRRILNGGTDYEYFDTIQAGDILTASSKVAEIVERKGSLGPMVITTTQTTYKRDGKVVAISRGTGIAY
jgi:hydroxyacyl-ACP dehydratase HTD2-like protein with hotdog domain